MRKDGQLNPWGDGPVRARFGRSGTVVFLSLLLAFLMCSPNRAHAVRGVLGEDQVWHGRVVVEDDLFVPAGRTLRILPGTQVQFVTALSTKTEPLFWNPDTELTVAGRLIAEGTAGEPVEMEGTGTWGGVAAAPGGSVELRHTTLRGADEAVLCVDADCRLESVHIEQAEYGLVVGPGARFSGRRVAVRSARVGILDARSDSDRSPDPLSQVTVRDSEDADLLRVPLPRRRASPLDGVASPLRSRVEILGDHTVDADRTWSGEVVLSGRVTVVPGAVLTLEAGTRVAFRKNDTNGDGLGEAELLILGGIRALGEPARPVVFESAEVPARRGDWDKVSLIASEDPDNRFRYAIFRHGVQALHAHFSRLTAEDCLFEDNLRALQFQESDATRVERSVFLDNKQALRFRDSRVWVRDCRFLDNLYGVHAFRSEVDFTGSVLESSALGGFLAKESRVLFSGNRVSRGRDGLRMKDPESRARILDNRLEWFAEDALSFQHSRAEVRGNRVRGAGLDLVGSEDSELVLRGNHLLEAGRHALHLQGATDVDARGNWWGVSDPSALIHDVHDDPARGTAQWHPPLEIEKPLRLPAENW